MPPGLEVILGFVFVGIFLSAINVVVFHRGRYIAPRGAERRRTLRRTADRYDYFVRVGTMSLAMVAGLVTVLEGLFRLFR